MSSASGSVLRSRCETPVLGDGKLKTIGVVPARKGSKGAPGKNIAPLLGKPLYLHAVETGLSAGLDEVVVSSDIPQILTAALPPEARAVERPAALAQDDTPMAAVLTHLFAQDIQGDALIVLLQPTSPLRRPAHIQSALQRYAEGRFSLVMSVAAIDNSGLKTGLIEDGRFTAVRRTEDLFSNRQSLPPLFKPNGAVYVFSAADFRAAGGFPAQSIGAVEMSAADSIDIDKPQDLSDCEALLQQERRGP